MILYNWSRKNPQEQLRLYGLFTVSAAYLPLVMFTLSFMLGGVDLAKVDFLGMAVGHLYFYFEEVIPAEFGEEKQFLRAPRFLHALFPNDNNNQPQPQEQNEDE